jgi:hypothetical protein
MALALLAACDADTSGAARDTKQSLDLAEQAAVTVGIPAIQNFAEKRQLKALYELRDTANLVTYTYYIDLNGKRHKVCPTTSIGFGIPYATQYTAPKSLVMRRGTYPQGTQAVEWKYLEADQPEPNGLYMPSSADGTWVICLDPKTKQASPTYVEPRIVVYLFEMPSEN